MRIPVLSIVAFCGFISVMGVQRAHAEDVEKDSEVYERIAESLVYVNETNDDNEIEEEAVYETEPAADYVSPINFDELSELNSFTCAWVKIEDTQVDYPVVFDGSDQFLKKDFYGDESYSGTIYVDSLADEDNLLNERCNILYGHNMKNGSMFAAVDDYTNADYYADHQDITLFLKNREVKLTPMACIVGKADDAVRNIHTLEDLEAFSADKTVAQGELNDFSQIWILVTCNYWDSNNRTYLICEEAK